MLDKNYDPCASEQTLYEAWERSGAFSPHGGDSSPFTIVIPPPNITGNLHIGHALNNVIQDILVRTHRLRGSDVLWQPGTDHASIATQMVVERRLEESGEPSRHELGREEFLRRVWEWRDESGGNITNQLRCLGSSCDWSRERFTMDEGLSSAVLRSFVSLHKAGLIYRDKRLVNWDPVMETAISDLEVIQTETRGSLWYFRYPLEDGSGEITVATTRPETMLGDTGIAVHPDDERYRRYIGSYAVHPLTGFRLLIVGDEHADPEQGSGAVKMTPAHDFNDFEVGKRHGLEMINIMTLRGAMNDSVPEKYRGMDRFDARLAVIRDMESLGFYGGEEEHDHVVPYGDRGGVPIEPLLTDQWFVAAETLAEPAIRAVREGRIKFVPGNWEQVYYDWMENIQPWCISRQLWWGHQIPAWYGDDGEIFVEHSEEEAYISARKHYGRDDIELRRDEDVLDTWYSSALWPFSTLGWPDDNAILRKHYPTDVLVTAFDIIFFWVARMIMFGLYFMDEEPFHTVYVHALVRDSKGQKMSKSKGNVIDPLDLVQEYGCDALRFTLASLAVPGRDIKLSTDKVASSRNFITKIWNAARFCELNHCQLTDKFNPSQCHHNANQWMVEKTLQAEKSIQKAVQSYRFHDAASTLYHFIWNDFCDNYLEMIKPIFNGEEGQLKQETQACAAWILQQILILIHPYTPFVSEKLWQTLYPDSGLLINARYPDYQQIAKQTSKNNYHKASEEIQWALNAITAIRSARATLNIGAGKILPLSIFGLSSDKKQWLNNTKTIIEKMARTEKNIEIDDDVITKEFYFKQSIRISLSEGQIIIPAEVINDIAAEEARLKDDIKKQENEIKMFKNKLGNKKFTEKAPVEIVNEVKDKLALANKTLESLNSSLSMLCWT